MYDPASVSRQDVMVALWAVVNDRSAGEPFEPVPLADLTARPSAKQLYYSSLNLGLVGLAIRVPVLGPVAFVSTLLVAGKIVLSGIRAIVVERKIKVDILDAMVVALLLGFNRPQAAAVMAWVVDIGNAMLEATYEQSRKLLTDLFGSQPRKAWLRAGGTLVECRIADLQKDDIIEVQTGEVIPVDGEIAEGEAVIDQHVLTGEAAAVERAIGQPVYAMTMVLAGRIAVRVREAGDSTNAAKIVQIINHSMEHKVRLQSKGEAFADGIVLPTIGVAGVGYALQGSDAMIAIINADFGTGIRVAAPLALLASLSIAARHGIVVKDGAVLERLPEIDVVVFDKTGTLTRDTPEVGRIFAADGRYSREQVLAYAACAERRLSHPIARAILRRAEELRLELPEIDKSSYRVGFGIEVEVEGRELRIGSRRYMEREGMEIPQALRQELPGIEDLGRSTIFAAIDQRVIGMLELQASDRPEISRLLEVLRRDRGLHEIHLLSGDHEAATRSFALRLGITDYVAEALPEDKAEYIRSLQRRGLKVAMVGDGINDSVALSLADVSISLRGGADVANDIAHIVFMDGDLAKFDLLFQIAERLNQNIRRSLYMTVGGNSVLILGALGGVFGIGSSLVLNNVVNLIATLNGLAPHYQELVTDPYGLQASSPA